MDKKNVLIMGAGLSGLTAALELSKEGYPLVLLEKEDRPGGLTRTFTYNGSRFDIGGHRFFTLNNAIEDYFLNLFDKRLPLINRRSSIFKNGIFLQYPPSFLDLPKLAKIFGLTTILKIFKKLIWKGKAAKTAETFEDWAKFRFGQEVYSSFLGPYIGKFWGFDPGQISSAWANQRIKGLTLGSIVKEFFFRSNASPKSFTRKFFYPENGIGELAERIREKLPRAVEIDLNSEVEKISHDNFRIIDVQTRSKKFKADIFVSTIPLTEFIDKLSPPAPAGIIEARRSLEFRDWIGVNIIMDQERFSQDQWIYFPEPNISFSRLQQWVNWSKNLIQPGRGAFMLEFLCRDGDYLSGMADSELIKLAKEDFYGKVKLLRNDCILEEKVIRIKNAYPVYTKGFSKHLDKIMDFLAGFNNLHLAGRGGRFKYLNMDHALEMGIKLAKNIQGEKHNLDNINYKNDFLG